MQFKGIVLAHEDTGYTGKRGFESQGTLTCIDADAEVKMKDTVDCVFKPEIIPEAVQLVGKTVVFKVDQIDSFAGRRVRFKVKGIVKDQPAK